MPHPDAQPLPDAVALRLAGEADLPGIMAIYNDAVLHTTAIWNDHVVDLDNRRAWLADRAARNHPVLVAVRDGAVLGYASYGDWRLIDGFRRSKELSIYVEAGARGLGLGKALLAALEAEARARGVHVLIGCIDASNTASMKLHAQAGFRLVGIHREVGEKFGRRLDLACMEKMLGAPGEAPPAA